MKTCIRLPRIRLQFGIRYTHQITLTFIQLHFFVAGSPNIFTLFPSGDTSDIRGLEVATNLAKFENSLGEIRLKELLPDRSTIHRFS